MKKQGRKAKREIKRGNVKFTNLAPKSVQKSDLQGSIINKGQQTIFKEIFQDDLEVFLQQKLDL